MFHYHCLRTKLDKRWPGARITFGFLECPTCKGDIDAPMLHSILEPMRQLREEIATKAVERLKIEGLDKDHRLSDPQNPKYFRNPRAFSLDALAYYICYQCTKPYFGGQRRCEDAAREQSDQKVWSAV